MKRALVLATVLGLVTLTTSACISGRVGGRTSYRDDDTHSGFYGGFSVYNPPFVAIIDDEGDLGLPFGLEVSFNFAPGSKENFGTISPFVGISKEKDIGAPAAFVTLGLEWSKSGLAFHTGVCGGFFSILGAYACSRVSTHGWVGLDGNLSLALPVYFEIDDGIGPVNLFMFD